MADFLIESGRRSARPSLVQAMMSGSNAKYEEDKRTLNALVEESGCFSLGICARDGLELM